MDDIDKIHMDFIAEQNKTTKAHTRKASKRKTIKVRSSVEVARSEYKRSKKQHKEAIKALKRDIKKHKLLIKQSRATYKLVRLSNNTPWYKHLF